MEKSKCFTNLIVWQKARQCVLNIYRVSSQFPRNEIFGLTSQIKRAAVSVPANIVEGYKRKTDNDKKRMFNIA